MGLMERVVTRKNVHKICRLCLEVKEISLLLSEEREVLHVTTTILEMFKKITSNTVTIDDGLPQLLCTDCIKLLEASYAFQLMYEKSVSVLNDFLTCAKEVSDDENHVMGGNNSDDMLMRVKVEDTKQVKKRCHKKKRKTVKSLTKIKSEALEEDFEVKEKAILHPCPICTLELPALELKQHAQSHKALKKYLNIPKEKKVSLNTRFSAEQDMSNVTSLFNKTGEKHICPYCNRSFTVEDFRIHIDSHRNQDEYKCEDCGRLFKKLNHLNTHRVKHLKEHPYKCAQCGKGFVIQTNYDCHMLTHTNAELPHECKYCLKRFSNPEHLNRHVIIHTENVSYSIKYKVCKCNNCLKTFKDKKELQNHSCVPVENLTKTGYTCKRCNKVFRYSSGLYNHNKNIHKLKGVKTLCSVCGNYVSNIYNHMMRHSGEKPFSCNQCEKSFSTKSQLRQHLLVHSGLKPYVCSVCAKAFNNLYNLQVHERIHKGNKCHVCVTCGKGFLEKSYLRKHMQVHTKS